MFTFFYFRKDVTVEVVKQFDRVDISNEESTKNIKLNFMRISDALLFMNINSSKLKLPQDSTEFDCQFDLMLRPLPRSLKWKSIVDRSEVSKIFETPDDGKAGKVQINISCWSIEFDDSGDVNEIMLSNGQVLYKVVNDYARDLKSKLTEALGDVRSSSYDERNEISTKDLIVMPSKEDLKQLWNFLEQLNLVPEFKKTFKYFGIFKPNLNESMNLTSKLGKLYDGFIEVIDEAPNFKGVMKNHCWVIPDSSSELKKALNNLPSAKLPSKSEEIDCLHSPPEKPSFGLTLNKNHNPKTTKKRSEN